MIILGLESSCDDTGCGIIEDGVKVLASSVASQIEVHRPFGGVVPEVAARSHLTSIDSVVDDALEKAQLSIDDIDAVAVTQGPGLIGALLVAVSYARGLATSLNTPLIPVNHVHAHLHASLLGYTGDVDALFPGIGLVVSGGHTHLYYLAAADQFQLVAHSIDDACGECFDKVGKLLGFAYPGGPKIEKCAEQSHDKIEVTMPRMIAEKDRLVFSYSGLKTHMVNLLQKNGPAWLEQYKPEVCSAFQEEALGQVVRKLSTALEQYHDARSVIVSGGVAANKVFRAMLKEAVSCPVVLPDLKYCVDNGAMIASNAYFKSRNLDIDSMPKWSEPWDAYSRYPYGVS